MGMTYINQKMIGTFVRGQINNLYNFLERQGYKITEEQREEIEEGGQFNFDIVKLLQLGEIDIVNINSWSGDDFMIGYHVNDNYDKESIKKEFQKFFPNIDPTYTEFIKIT